jgi:hypothetical protein
MENVNVVESVPEYITTFINNNIETIKNIIEKEKERGDGFIYIDIHVKENKLNLLYFTNEEVGNIGTTIEFLKSVNEENKTTIIINDNEYKTRFILYI